MWPFRRSENRSGGDAEASQLRADLAAVTSELRALRRDLDDLDESFRRYRSRRAKQDPADDTAPAAANGASRARLPTVAQLRAAGSFPFKG